MIDAAGITPITAIPSVEEEVCISVMISSLHAAYMILAL